MNQTNNPLRQLKKPQVLKILREDKEYNVFVVIISLAALQSYPSFSGLYMSPLTAHTLSMIIVSIDYGPEYLFCVQHSKIVSPASYDQTHSHSLLHDTTLSFKQKKQQGSSAVHPRACSCCRESRESLGSAMMTSVACL